MASKNVDEYLVCVPKYDVKKYNVMRFNAGDKVDIRVRFTVQCNFISKS